jgi:hypothetical protein
MTYLEQLDERLKPLETIERIDSLVGHTTLAILLVVMFFLVCQ